MLFSLTFLVSQCTLDFTCAVAQPEEAVGLESRSAGVPELNILQILLFFNAGICTALHFQ